MQAEEEHDAFRGFADRLSSGEDDAATALLARYSARLTALARSRLSPGLGAKADPEDVVQSVMRTFFRRLGTGEVELRDWSSLTSLLSMLTIRKCSRHQRRHFTASRDARREISISRPGRSGATAGFLVPDREPTPDEVATFADLTTWLLDGLDDRDRRAVELVLQGEQVEAVAVRLGRSRRTIYRVLERARRRLLSADDDTISGET